MAKKVTKFELVPVKDEDHYWSINLLDRYGKVVFKGLVKYESPNSCEDAMLRFPSAAFEVDLVPIRDRAGSRAGHYKGAIH